MGESVHREAVGRQDTKAGELPDLDKYLGDRRRQLVSYSEGARLYRIPYYSFVRLAKEAKANYIVRKTVIVDIGLVEKYLAKHPDVVERVNRVREV